MSEAPTPDAAPAVPPAAAKALGGPIVAFFAAQGPGYGAWNDTIGWQGGFVAGDGSIVYCIEPGMPTPIGTSSDLGWQNGVVSRSPFGNRTITDNDAARIGRIVAEYGQTWDNRQSSAVSFAVKFVANPDAMYESHNYNGPHTLAGFVNWVLNSSVGGPEAAAVAARAEQILAETAGTTAGPVIGSGTMDFNVDPVNNYNGTVTASAPGAPAGATATLSLNNGVFVATGTPTLVGQLNTAYEVRGIAPDDGADWKISGSAKINSGYSAAMHIWDTGTKQKTAGPGQPSSFDANGEDPLERAPDFQPQAISNAPRFAKPGDKLTDTATFQLAADENGRINEWFRNSKGEYAPTEWTVEAYKVAKAPKSPIEELPADAELIATTTVSTGFTGPTEAKTADFGDAVMPADGSPVVYVWKFEASKQPERIQPLFPEDYSWEDLFGLAAETTFGVDVTTKAQPGAKKGTTSTDTAIVTGVLPNEGLNLTFEKYYVPMVQDATGKWVPNAPEGTEAGDLSWVCTADNLVGDNRDEPQKITTAGEYTSPAIPSDKYGIELWVEELSTIPTDETPSVVVDRGECGEKSETTYVVDVTTQAYSDSGPGTVKRGDQLWDTGLIKGWVPEGATITFERFTVPANSKLVCTAETLDWTSQPVTLASGLYLDDNPLKADSGTHPAPDLKGGAVTTFVETTRDVDGRIISKGECGEPTETLSTPASGKLATTGGDGLNVPLLATGGGLALGGLALALLKNLRRRRAAEIVDGTSAD